MFAGGYIRVPMGRGVRTLLIINVSVFLLGVLLDPGAAFSRHEIGPLTSLFGLSLGCVRQGMIWQFLTYMFLHADLFHIVANMFGLYFMGRQLESALGTRRFVQLYLASGVLGGLGWLVLSGSHGMPCVGASAAVFGIVCAFSAMFPRQKLTLLVYFIFPVTMTALTLALVLVGGSFFMLVLGRSGGVAHAAHLSGAVVGYLYGKSIGGASVYGGGLGGGGMGGKWSMSNLKAWYRRKQYKVLSNDDNRPVNWSEVDAILDKIKFRGVNGLTRDEKETLDRASRAKR